MTDEQIDAARRHADDHGELNTQEYRDAVCSMLEEAPLFSVAYDWHDKPHRLVYDLCKEIDRLRAIKEASHV